MSCVSGAPTFRLLDHLVGWDPLDVHGLTNPDDPGGIRLARTGPRGLVRGDLLPWLPDPRLAPGCGRCAWYLATPQRGLLRRDPCTDWRPVWPSDCDPGLARHPHALSARGHLLAAATPEAVYVWRRDGDQLVAVIPGYASAVALAPWGEVLLARDGSTDLDRYELAGSGPAAQARRQDRNGGSLRQGPARLVDRLRALQSPESCSRRDGSKCG